MRALQFRGSLVLAQASTSVSLHFSDRHLAVFLTSWRELLKLLWRYRFGVTRSKRVALLLDMTTIDIHIDARPRLRLSSKESGKQHGLFGYRLSLIRS
ncbi:hypothetical protein [Ferrimonas gelatinilytica]|uniref:Transposase DDE domain-containing protein n=1 Tax=Ferrimonas gelatinilytica TaxID=1255257 RepID=A0ABP9S9P8_9GAMM